MRKTKPARPEWAERLERLRLHLGLSQAALARRLDVSPMAASRWERGINQPTASIYVQLGKLAGPPDCWFFWEQAGLSKADVAAASKKRSGPHKKPELESGVAFTGWRAIAAGKVPTLAALPVHATLAPIGTDTPNQINRESTTDYGVAPRSWCPHPEKTICLRVGDDSMAPALKRDFIFAVDESDHDEQTLEGKLVLACHPQHGLVVRWFQRFGKARMLVPENRSFSPIYMDGESWSINGRVIWWYGMAP